MFLRRSVLGLQVLLSVALLLLRGCLRDRWERVLLLLVPGMVPVWVRRGLLLRYDLPGGIAFRLGMAFFCRRSILF
jgi:hypothetical protein